MFETFGKGIGSEISQQIKAALKQGSAGSQSIIAWLMLLRIIDKGKYSND